MNKPQDLLDLASLTLPLTELQRRELFTEVYRHAAGVGAALVPICETDEELIEEVKRVRQSWVWLPSSKLH